jgi:hypothetical protein
MESLLALSLHKALSVFGLAGAVLTFLYARNLKSLIAVIVLVGTVCFCYTVFTKRFGTWFFYDTLTATFVGPGAVCILVFLIMKQLGRTR